MEKPPVAVTVPVKSSSAAVFMYTEPPAPLPGLVSMLVTNGPSLQK
jgi:hypothetical protein